MSRYPAVDLLSVVLRRQPSLPGALCRGRYDLFDSEEPDDVAQAVALCGHCPDLDTCRAWVGSLTAKSRPAGVVAGRLWQRQKRGSVVGV